MDKMKIAKRLKDLRLKAGLTIMEVAKLCGVGDSTVRMWELGQRTPSDKTKAKIASLYKSSVDAIFFT